MSGPPPPAPAAPADLAPVIGHRGAAGGAPENTLASLARAAGLGLRWAECDVRLSRDGVPHLLHDAGLERTTSGGGALAERDAAEVAELDAGTWFDRAFRGERVPTLDAALALAGERGLGLNLELKADGADPLRLVEAVAAALGRARREVRVLVSSFEPRALEAARARLPGWSRGLLVEHPAAPDWARAQELGCSCLGAREDAIEAAHAHRAAASGLLLLAYTVNDRARAEELWQAGVHAVFSDHPERLLPRILAPTAGAKRP